MELHETITSWFSQNKLMQLATAVDNQPWICTVGFVTDDEFTIYWFSRTDRRHSIEVMQNSKVAVTIVQDIRTRQALQITGVAERLPGDEIERVYSLYVAKLGFAPASMETLRDSDEVSFWRVKPTTITAWDEANFPADPKRQYSL